ncbi:MAG TPA: phenylalanine--tRNA ligase subunit alpha [Bacteroidales bacterium]|nr:phenylalanine--tRNA ligase subunit alpha [Bacteroidales bacterium]HNS46320.1 phenylalanine--tRNA ligase subunit alpha [Bacteroidales bacterium]
MREKIRYHLGEIQNFNTTDREELEQFRIRFLSKKGIITGLFDEFKTVAPDQRRELGLLLNELKNAAQLTFDDIRQHLEASVTEQKPVPDLTLPADFMDIGSRHPLSIVQDQIITIFSRIGFNVAEGPDIEDDWHNFSALNFEEEHPARDMQDTFFVQGRPPFLLRTHTSSVQIRMMEKTTPPIRALFPGRVYRNEAISARAHCLFHQVEGLYVDRNVSFADLKQTLLYFAREMFGENTGIRLRPSYFPFTEPSAEMDISCFICGGKGCRICKNTGWVEILGCGMVDPAVFENCGIDSSEYTGFAFGMGIERTAMLRYQINDIRLFFENDVRFLRQFRSAF